MYNKKQNLSWTCTRRTGRTSYITLNMSLWNGYRQVYIDNTKWEFVKVHSININNVT